MSISQGEAVFQAVTKVLSQNHMHVEGKVSLTDDQLEAVHDEVFMAFETGLTVHSKNPSPEALRKYIPGLVNNWLRKDTRLNGGTKYTTKNPGSRTGSTDESIKAMRTLLSVTTDPAVKDQINSAIEARLEELKPKPTINTAALPESLRHLVG